MVLYYVSVLSSHRKFRWVTAKELGIGKKRLKNIFEAVPFEHNPEPSRAIQSHTQKWSKYSF